MKKERRMNWEDWALVATCVIAIGFFVYIAYVAAVTGT